MFKGMTVAAHDDYVAALLLVMMTIRTLLTVMILPRIVMMMTVIERIPKPSTPQ